MGWRALPFTRLPSSLVANRFAPYDELKEILEDTGRRELMGLQRGLVALPALELFGITPPVSIVLSTTAIQLWFMTLGFLFLWRAWRSPA